MNLVHISNRLERSLNDVVRFSFRFMFVCQRCTIIFLLPRQTGAAQGLYLISRAILKANLLSKSAFTFLTPCCFTSWDSVGLRLAI